MTSLNHKIKINNSYESEPSSGSGSSLSEHNDGLSLDDDNLNLPYLLKPPPLFDDEITTSSSKSTLSTSKANSTFASRLSSTKKPNSQLTFGVLSMISSEESSFEGFGDSPFGKLQKRFYGQNNNQQNLPQNQHPIYHECSEPPPSSGKIIFAKYYDTIVEENSCNAIDVQLSNEPLQQRLSGSSGSDNNSPTNDTDPSLKLSFNGRIKSLKIESFSEKQLEDLPSTSCSVDDALDTSMLNTSKLTESFMLKKYSNEKSPDLFGDDDEDDDNDDSKNYEAGTDLLESEQNDSQQQQQLDVSLNKSFNCPTESSFTDEQTLDYTASTRSSHNLLHENRRRDKEILRRIRKCLSGLPPPPSLTIPQLNLFDEVLTRKDEILNFLKEPIKVGAVGEQSNTASSSSSLLRPTHTLDETKTMAWRDILGVRQHGLSFNLTEASESKEYLNLSVVERFVGAETASSYRNSPSSAKKRNIRMKLLPQSPGNRLSHLARRRAIFSSANLATTSHKTSNLIGPQLIQKKKIKHRRKGTPKRKTPGSKKKTGKTPSSSARKRQLRCDLNTKAGPSRETSKRALFQSPAKQIEQKLTQTTKPVINPKIASRVEKSKRALFSPDNKHTNTLVSASSSLKLETLLKRKRNAIDDDDDDAMELTAQSSKLFRGSAENLTPRALKIKSQSFCIGAGSSTATEIGLAARTGLTSSNAAAAASSRHFGLMSSSQVYGGSAQTLVGNKMQRSHSDMVAQSNSLTENQRKKLLWAVSQALQEKKITAKHESFKQYASVLARVVRRIFQEYYHRSSSSNSETLLRLTKKYVYNVIAGKSADDIYFQAKAQIDERKHQSNSRLSGYIGQAEYEQRKSAQRLFQSQNCQMGSMQNIFAPENSMDSFSMCLLSQTSSSTVTTAAVDTQDILSEQFAEDILLPPQNSKYLPIQPSASLQNSSSKSNIGGLALRENVDGEQRRSAQKNFTGKDQRNMSPYAPLMSIYGASVSRSSELNLSGAKAKRQISFDS